MSRFALKRPVGAMVVVVATLVVPAWAMDEAAPFGFTWSPLDKIPRPSSVLKEANVTVLLYRGDRLPTNTMTDTELVLLDVCKKEGLQQISWVSKPLSAKEAIVKFTQIVALGVKKYGESKPTSEGALAWENERIEA